MTTPSPADCDPTGLPSEGITQEIPLLNHTQPGETLFDPFCGSGTALIAAEKTGRRCVALEIDPQYVQVAVSRWEAFTGQSATVVGGGR